MSGDMYIVRSKDKAIFERGECGGSVTSILKYALESGMVDGVVATQAKDGDRYSGIPVLITKAEELIKTTGSLHTATPNIARFVKLHLNGASNMKLAIVGKPCDIKAVIELQKRNQINAENLLLIGLNCTGTLSPIAAKKMFIEEFEVDPLSVKREDIDDGELIIFLEDGTRKSKNLAVLEKKGYGRRENCRRCETNIPTMADLACGKWGTEELEIGGTFIEICSEKGRALIEKAIEKEFIEVETPNEMSIQAREKKNQTEIELARDWIDRDLKPLQELNTKERLEFWLSEFNKCIKCFGCRDACPICYCENCLLEANREYLEKGSIPPNIVFPLTRLSHVADSCVNCGQCQDACPMELPLSKLYTLLHKKLSTLFDYRPGLDVEQPPPLLAINEEEKQIDNTFLDFSIEHY